MALGRALRYPTGRTGPVRLYQKEQVQEDMQTITRATAIEQMLESADHLIENHRVTENHRPAVFDRSMENPDLPPGCILYSAELSLDGVRKGWNVEVMDTMMPFQDGSIVSGDSAESLDSALRQASYKVLAARSRG